MTNARAIAVWLFVATFAALLPSASPKGTQESFGFGKKFAAAIPSFAVSGAGTKVAVHGLNFAPGGARTNGTHIGLICSHPLMSSNHAKQ